MELIFSGQDTDRSFVNGNEFSTVSLHKPSHTVEASRYWRNPIETRFSITTNKFKEAFLYDKSKKVWIPRQKGRLFLKNIAFIIDVVDTDKGVSLRTIYK